MGGVGRVLSNPLGAIFGGLTPKVPKPPPAPNMATQAEAGDPSAGIAPSAASLISTSAQGLRRKANTQKTSLIGGA